MLLGSTSPRLVWSVSLALASCLVIVPCEGSPTTAHATTSSQSVLTGCASGIGIHNVTVSHSGSDNLTCLNGQHNHCLTLEYVLNNTQGCTNVSVTYSQTLTHPIWLPERIMGITIIGTLESDMVHVRCKDGVHAGIGFRHAQNISIHNIAWSGCALEHTTFDPKGNATSALYFSDGEDIQLTQCMFSGNRGTGVSMYNVGGHVVVSDTTFDSNRPELTFECSDVPMDDNIPTAKGRKGGGLYIEHSCSSTNSTTSYNIQRCVFRFNENKHVVGENDSSYSPAGKGGGVAVILIGRCHGYNVTIDSCLFSNNSAIWGGAFVAETVGEYGDNDIILSNTTFFGNIGCNSGGGVHIGTELSGRHSNHSQYGNSILVRQCLFDSNAALHGGGAYLHSNTTGNETLDFVACKWIENVARTSGFGAAVALNSSAQNSTLVAEFQGCNFSLNYYNVTWKRKFTIDSQGAVFSLGVPLKFSRGPLDLGGRGTVFIRNYGTALAVHSTDVYMKHTVEFNNNSGVFGGGVFLIGTATITLDHTTLYFTGNSALVHGGAIYTRLPSVNTNTSQQLPCIFASTQGSTVHFTDNTVNERYESIYINNPSGCNHGSLLEDAGVFEYSDPNGVESIVTIPSNITFLDPHDTRTERDTFEKMAGETFTVFPIVHDQFGHKTQTIAFVELGKGDAPLAPYDISAYRLIGPDTIMMGNHTNNTQFYITGPEVERDNDTNSDNSTTQELTMIFIANAEVGAFTAYLKVQLVPCKLGYVYDPTTQTCVCDSDSQLNVKCPAPGVACVRYGYWYGHIPEFKSPVIHPCPSQYCQYNEGACPKGTTSCGLNYCTLTESSDDVCWEGRSGVLCGDCAGNYSFTYEAVKCAPSHTCKPGNTALYILAVFGYWVVFIVGLLLLLRLNLRIGSGYVYGIMYYFSVIIQVIDDKWPSDTVRTIVNMCLAATQLCPKILSEINVCFAQSWDSVMHEFFHYTTPVFVSAVLLTIIGVAWYCRLPKVISPAEHSPIHAICILILLAYSSLTYTNFKILTGVQFNGSSTLYSELQPSIKYFHPQRHLPYALIAIVIEACVVVPFCFLLLFAPCLSSRANFVKLKIKPILDEFQACYRDDCRWFAGYYLLCRQLVYLVKIIPPAVPALYLSQYLNVFILIIHASFQPYQDKWLNTIDTLLLVDLVMLSMLYGPTYHFFELANVPSTAIVRKISTYILVLVPCFYLLGVVVVLVLKRSRVCLSARLRKCCCLGKRGTSRTVVGLSSQPSTSTVEVSDSHSKSGGDKRDKRASEFGSSFLLDPGEREPLLAYQDNSKYYEEVEEKERQMKSHDLECGHRAASVTQTTLRSFPPSSKKATTN